MVLFLVLISAGLALYNVVAVLCGKHYNAHQRWLYVACTILAPMSWMLLGIMYPLGTVLGGACKAMPNGGGLDNLLLVRVLVPPKILPMARRLITSCLVDSSAVGESEEGDGEGPIPFMLDVIGMPEALLNGTFDAFQLDKQIDMAALARINLQTGTPAALLLTQLTRPLVNYTGQVCEVYSHSSCMFQAVTCNASGFPLSLDPSAFDCSSAAECNEACECCKVLALVLKSRLSAQDALGHVLTINSSLATLQRNAVNQLDPVCSTCESPSLALELEALRQQALLLNASCESGTFGFGTAYEETRVSICLSLQSDFDMVWLTIGIIGNCVCACMSVFVCD